jgi:hypothetical protein
MKKTILPKSFVIERQDSPLWDLFIADLNKIFVDSGVNRQLSGTCAKYYGIFLDVPILSDEVPEGVELIPLAMYADDANFSYETITTYDGFSHPEFACVQISEDAESHPGEWALRFECKYANENQAYALARDVCKTLHGGFFIRGTEESLNIVWSEFHSDWLCTDNDYVYYGYVGHRHEDYFFSRHAVEIDDNYYYSNEIAEECGFRYHRGHCEWYDECDYPCEVSECNASYHDLSRRDYSNNSVFKIAFEIEKEDSEAGLIHYDDLHHNTGWCKESDGSLDDENGYELVSPIFDLYSDDLEKAIDKHRDLKTLINAEYSDNCGGHINVSCTTIRPNLLFEGMSAFMPLLYALYEDRLDKSYSKAKVKHQYHTERDKYSSVFIKDNLVEFRIFPAVRSVANLLWRRDLIRIMVDNMNRSELDVLRMILNKKSKLHNHLRLIFSEDKILQKADLFMRYSEVYNYKKLPNYDKDKYTNQKPRKGNDNLDSTNELGA